MKVVSEYKKMVLETVSIFFISLVIWTARVHSFLLAAAEESVLLIIPRTRWGREEEEEREAKLTGETRTTASFQRYAVILSALVKEMVTRLAASSQTPLITAVTISIWLVKRVRWVEEERGRW